MGSHIIALIFLASILCLHIAFNFAIFQSKNIEQQFTYSYLVLQDLIRGITEEVEFHKKEVQILRVEKDELEKVLTTKTGEVRENLQSEATRVEEDLKKNLSQQRTENQKLQNQISILKQEKTQLQQNLLGLQRRIGELELSIGQTAMEGE